jgi:pimeloyl-ACP methyl ester carboxylesterase/nucleoside-diphosphate-sugar epimerase
MRIRILLTGATTLVGAEVLRELLLRTDVEAIRLLLPADQSARRAIGDLETYLRPMPPSVTAVAGDIRLPRFGLSLIAWEELATSFDLGFHCAQREIKDQNIELARQANVRPVENWIQLLDLNSRLRLHHLSTAFVGGKRRGLLTEFDLDCGQDFHNAWERSKFEAEVSLRECQASDRVTAYRPSHILGRAATGEAFHLGGAYPLLASLAAASVLPGDSQARIDLVPADYVAASMVALACSGETGTFHLVCGWEASLPVGQAATLAARGRGRSRGARLLPRGIAWPMQPIGATTLGGLASRSLAFTNARDMLHQGPVFDGYLADLALTPLGISCPAPESWLDAAVRGAEERHWEAPPAEELDEATEEAAPTTSFAEGTLVRKHPNLREKTFHRVGEVNVAYRDIGKGEPVVFLHGFAGAHSWDGVVERVASRRRALVVETLGLSDTEAPSSADFGLQAQAARLRGLLSALEIPAAHIVGNETGGVIAQMFAARWPNCLKSLVLSDCNAPGPWPPRPVKRIAALTSLPGGIAALAALMRIPAVARSRAGLGLLVHDRRLFTSERVSQYLYTVAGNRERRMRLKRFVRSLGRSDLNGTLRLLGQLKVPTMIIWGADNTCSSPSWAKTLADAIPGTRRLELIPFAGASCHEERPDLFARCLTEFLDEVGAETSGDSLSSRFSQDAHSAVNLNRF